MSLLLAQKKKIIINIVFMISLMFTTLLDAKTPLPSYAAQYSVFSGDGSQLIYVNAMGTEIIKIQVKTEKIIKRIPFKLKTGSTLLAPTPDGFKLLAVHSKGIDVIHNGTGKVLRTLPHPSGQYDWRGGVIQQNSNGSLLAIPSMRNNSSPKIYLIHTGSGKIIRQIKLLQRGKIGSIGFSPNKRLLAYTQYGHKKLTLYLYDISQQKQHMRMEIITTGDSYQEMIHFSRNNQQLVLSGINQKTVKLIDIKQKTIKQLPYPYSSFTDFSADNKSLLIIQPHKNTLTLRNIATGKQQINRLSANKTDYFATVIQARNKTLLALPKRNAKPKETASFLWIDARTGKAFH